MVRRLFSNFVASSLGQDRAWLEGVNDDVADHAAADFVLGEITCYRGRHFDSRYE